MGLHAPTETCKQTSARRVHIRRQKSAASIAMALVARPIALFLLFFCANIQNLIFGGRTIFPFREYLFSPCDRPDERAATRVIKDNVAAIFVYDPYKRKPKRSTENGDSSSLPLFLFRTIRVRFLVHNLKSSNQNEKRLPS